MAIREDWRGYTLDELRYRRAGNAAQMQAGKVMLNHRVNALRRGNPVTRSWQSVRGIFDAIGYVNSAVLAWQLGRRIWSVVRTVRGK